jgi:hypothetical protein
VVARRTRTLRRDATTPRGFVTQRDFGQFGRLVAVEGLRQSVRPAGYDQLHIGEAPESVAPRASRGARRMQPRLERSRGSVRPLASTSVPYRRSPSVAVRRARRSFAGPRRRQFHTERAATSSTERDIAIGGTTSSPCRRSRQLVANRDVRGPGHQAQKTRSALAGQPGIHGDE